MKRFTIPKFLATGVILVSILVGCSHGSGGPTDPGFPDGTNDTPDFTIRLVQGAETANEIEFTVELDDVVDVSALSFRIGFNAESLEPVSVEWGNLVDEEDATFHLLNRPGFVPLAFARMNGLSGLDSGGRLCTLRFRIRSRERVRAWVIDDPEYLVARDSLGRRLRMRVGGDGR